MPALSDDYDIDWDTCSVISEWDTCSDNTDYEFEDVEIEEMESNDEEQRYLDYIMNMVELFELD